jgi:curved DNA-binding protein CbpA
MEEQEEYEVTWKDYYAILGIDPDADPKAIKSAYASLIKRYHFEEEASDVVVERVKLLDEAYRCLSDPVARASYDKIYLVRRRKGPKALWKSSLSQVMLICPDCDAHNLYNFNRSTKKLRCPNCQAVFTSRAGKLKAISHNRSGLRWYYSITIIGLYDGKDQQVDFDVDFKIGASELQVRDNIVLTYIGPEFAIIQNLTTNYYWRLVSSSTTR